MLSWAKVGQYADQQLDALRSRLREFFESGSVDSVHQARVASRRLQEPLELARGRSKRKPIERAHRRLRRIRRALADTRELDVLLVSFEDGQTDALDQDEVRQLADVLEQERCRSLAKARGRCGRLDPDELEELLGPIFQDADSPAGCHADDVTACGRSLVGDRARLALALADAEAAGADLHRIRVALKRLRYAIEMQAAVSGEENDPLIKRFKHVQGLLGEWNDQVQAARRVSELARTRRLMIAEPGRSAAWLEHAAARVRRSRELAEAFLADWPAFQETVRSLVP